MIKEQKPRLWLKDIRITKGLNYAETAKKCDVDVSTYHRIESGQIASPRIGTAMKIAEGLGFNVERFFNE